MERITDIYHPDYMHPARVQRLRRNIEIYELRQGGAKLRELGERYGMHPSSIDRICMKEVERRREASRRGRKLMMPEDYGV